MPSPIEKTTIQKKKSQSHVMTTALLSIYRSTTGSVEHSTLYLLLKKDLIFEGKNKVELFGKALRNLENRGWVESTILREQTPPILVFKLTPRSKILFDLITEK